MFERPFEHLDSKGSNGINVRRHKETQQVYYESSPQLANCEKSMSDLKNCIVGTNSTLDNLDNSCKNLLESSKSACGLRRLLYVTNIKARVQNQTI
ncbi:hypothetical protein ABK040_001815 [Willaertia magna]